MLRCDRLASLFKELIIQSKPTRQYPVPVVTHLCDDSGNS